MAVSFSKITDVFGAEVDGVDIAAGVGETAMRDIVDLFNEYSILVFHDQKINDEQQICFSRLFSEVGHFGGLEKTVVQNASGGTEIADLSNVEPDTKVIIPPTDKRMVFNSGNEMWHTDSSFKRVPATASLLSGREVPPTGGETEFATERAAYADLSVAMRERIDPLIAIHDFAYNRSLIDPNLMTEEQKRETPPSTAGGGSSQPGQRSQEFLCRSPRIPYTRDAARRRPGPAQRPDRHRHSAPIHPSPHLARQRPGDLGQPLLPPPWPPLG